MVGAALLATTSTYLDNVARRRLCLGCLPRCHVRHAFLGLHLVVVAVLLWSKRVDAEALRPPLSWLVLPPEWRQEDARKSQKLVWLGAFVSVSNHLTHSVIHVFNTRVQVAALRMLACLLAPQSARPKASCKQRRSPKKPPVSRVYPLPLRCNSGLSPPPQPHSSIPTCL